MVSRSQAQKKAPQQSTSASVQNQLRSRPFAPPVQAETTPQAEPPDLQTQLENATRLGHSFSRMTARNAPTPPDAPATVFPRFPIQPKLTIGAPGDKYEQEADRVASQVVQRLQSPQIESPQAQQSVQRETMPEEEELQMKPLDEQIQREKMPEEDELQMKPMLQMKGGGAIAADAELENAIQQSRGSGQSLADNLRQPMEHAFGNVDFSGVKVHTDALSDQLNRSLQSKAFTTGQDVFFRQGAYEPGSQGGQELIAHELTHVVQQNGGQVRRSPLTPQQLPKHSATETPSASVGDRVLQIQRKTIAVAGGEFNDALIGDGYRASNEDESDSTGTYNKVGAKMELAFIPNPSLDAKQVSLVQTTNSTVQNQTNPRVADQSNSLLGERRTEAGTAIDQEIYLSKNSVKSGNQRWDTDRLLPLFQSIAGLGIQSSTNETIQKFITFFSTGKGSNNQAVSMLGINPTSINTQLKKALDLEGGAAAPKLQEVIPQITNIMALQAKSMNLDPRYSEERTNTDEPLKEPRKSGDEAGSGGWTAVKEDSDWKSSAALRDAPGHKIAVTDVVNGDERFETAAIADGQKFLGSIRWGYTVTNSVSTLNPATIELVNYGSASSELFKAAKKWNAMKVPDLYNEDEKHSTIQLPESDDAKNSASTAFELARWMPGSEVNEVMDGLGRATIEEHYDKVALGRIREGVNSVADLITLIIKLTEKRGTGAVTMLGDASQLYSAEGYKALCAKGIDQIITEIYQQG